MERQGSMASVGEQVIQRRSAVNLAAITRSTMDKMIYFKNLPAAMGVMKFTMTLFAVFMLAWSITASIILIRVSSYYLNSAIDMEREFYVTSGSIAHMHSKVRTALMPAYQSQIAMRRAVRAGIVTGSSSFAELELLFAPILQIDPRLSGIALVFKEGSETTTLTIGRARLADGSHRVMVQSDGQSCYTLGPQGCVSSASMKPLECLITDPSSCMLRGLPSWYSAALELSEDVGLPGEADPFASAWSRAEMAPRTLEDGTQEFIPTCHLLFKVSETSPGREPLTIVGRVTIDISTLSGARLLEDARLGPGGGVYLVDADKSILASKEFADLVASDGSGALNFRSISTMDTLGSFSGGLMQASRGSSATLYDSEGRLAALQWLPAPLDGFAVIALAPERTPFLNENQLVLSIVSCGWASLPYFAVVFGSIGTLLYQSFHIKDDGPTPESPS